MALAVANLPMAVVTPHILPRHYYLVNGMSIALQEAYREFADSVQNYAEKFPTCAPGSATAENHKLYEGTPECDAVLDYVHAQKSKCGFMDSGMAYKNMDKLECECQYSADQPLEPVFKCLDALCGEEDAAKAKKLAEEAIEASTKKCWEVVDVVEELKKEGKWNDTVAGKPGENVGDTVPSGGMQRRAVAGLLVLSVLLLPIFGAFV